jgi:branched-chain amino acid transport system permease protein
MSFWLIQCLNGLSHASTLFIMAAGLTLVFGVTRIVNFAHGSFLHAGRIGRRHLSHPMAACLV